MPYLHCVHTGTRKHFNKNPGQQWPDFVSEMIDPVILFFCVWRCDPTRVIASSFLRFLDHTQRRTTVGRLLWTSDQLVAETSTWQHTTLTTDKHPCPPVEFELTISAGERPQIYALDCAATGTGPMLQYMRILLLIYWLLQFHCTCHIRGGCEWS